MTEETSRSTQQTNVSPIDELGRLAQTLLTRWPASRCSAAGLHIVAIDIPLELDSGPITWVKAKSTARSFVRWKTLTACAQPDRGAEKAPFARICIRCLAPSNWSVSKGWQS